MKQKPKATAVVAEKPPIVAVVPALNSEFADLLEQDAGSGLQEMGRDDLAIPRLVVLQALSPQVSPRDPEYIDGAQAGDILDNINLTVYPGQTGFSAVVVSYRKSLLEWIPRNKGGGFVADHGENIAVLSDCKQENGRFVKPNGNEIVQTAEYFLLALDNKNGVRQCVLSMSSTQLRHSRRLNTLMSTYMIPHPKDPNKRIQAPSFFRLYRFSTGPEKNEKGSWFGWVIEPGEDVLATAGGQDLYLLARGFRQQVMEGKVTVAKPEDSKPTEDGNEAF